MLLPLHLRVGEFMKHLATLNRKLYAKMKMQGGCALFSLKRYREGCEAAFTDVPGGEYQQSEPPFPGRISGMEMGNVMNVSLLLDNQMQY